MGASLERAADSRELLKVGRYHGAMYLAGYAIECYLKFLICIRFDAADLREATTRIAKRTGKQPQLMAPQAHSFDLLMHHAGLLEDLRRDKDFAKLFAVVNEWSPGWRYWAHKSTRAEAERFCSAVQKLLIWLKEKSIFRERKWL